MSLNAKHGLNFYAGSELLTPVSEIVGLPRDQINYVAYQFIAFFLSILFLLSLSPTRVSPTVRYCVVLICGLVLGIFCFGWHIAHLVLQATLCLSVIYLFPPDVQNKLVFFIALTYLSIMHISRMIYDYGGYTLDITAPMMITTAKLSALSCSYRDGYILSLPEETRPKKAVISPYMKKYVLQEKPGILQFFSYIFYFQGLICGPVSLFSDFTAFIEGKVKHSSPVYAVAQKFLVVVSLFFLMLFVLPRFDPRVLHDSHFVQNSSFVHLNLFILCSMTLTRTKYYFVWFLGDMICNASGFGFSPEDGTEGEHWDLLKNVNIWGVEMSNSLKVNIDSWNIGIVKWLRLCVYERAPINRTFAVFLISAIWHGFYVGYYLMFFSIAYFTFAARNCRRYLRPFFLEKSPSHKIFYDCVTFLATRITNVYMVVPMVLLEFQYGWDVWCRLCFWLHWLALIPFLCFPFLAKFGILPLKSGAGRTKKE